MLFNPVPKRADNRCLMVLDRNMFSMSILSLQCSGGGLNFKIPRRSDFFQLRGLHFEDLFFYHTWLHKYGTQAKHPILPCSINHFTVVCLYYCLAFEWKWGWRWPCWDRNSRLFSCWLVGIYIRKADHVKVLSREGHLQPRFHSKARKLNTQLL